MSPALPLPPSPTIPLAVTGQSPRPVQGSIRDRSVVGSSLQSLEVVAARSSLDAIPRRASAASADVERAVLLRQGGASFSEIAAVIGWPRTAVWRLLNNRADVPRTRPRGNNQPNAFEGLPDGSVAIELQDGIRTIVDAETFDAIRGRRWHAEVSSKQPGQVYVFAGTTRPGQRVWLHKYILGIGAGEIGDHIDRDTLNNRKINLRIATAGGSSRNRSLRLGASGYRGVRAMGSSTVLPFAAFITVNYKKIGIGRYKTAVEAALAYDEASRKLHGAFGVLNFSEAQS